jgi:hypothetical protein
MIEWIGIGAAMLAAASDDPSTRKAHARFISRDFAGLLRTGEFNLAAKLMVQRMMKSPNWPYARRGAVVRTMHGLRPAPPAFDAVQKMADQLNLAMEESGADPVRQYRVFEHGISLSEYPRDNPGEYRLLGIVSAPNWKLEPFFSLYAAFTSDGSLIGASTSDEAASPSWWPHASEELDFWTIARIDRVPNTLTQRILLHGTGGQHFADGYTAAHELSPYPSEDIESIEPVDTVFCKFCGDEAKESTAHIHQGEWVGECCWDERLRVTM